MVRRPVVPPGVVVLPLPPTSEVQQLVPVTTKSRQHVQNCDRSPAGVPQPSSLMKQPAVISGSAEEGNKRGPGHGGGPVAPGGRLDGSGVLQIQHLVSCQPTLLK